ncbi:MAG TPA: type II toxin-antitoxin system VapC family toxin [Lacisediminihabitans sp.]|uniref:type II toxin-antitoxin system VapC family toxin n=1 Tax=Lacisediminihabitans sp. TaxID=2787631 RepID=UPI002EDB9061
MTAVVVDSSMLIDTLVAVDGAELRHLIVDFELHAPHLLGVEVMSWLRRLSLHTNLSPTLQNHVFAQYERLPIQRYPHEPFLARAWQFRDTITAYDSHYVALAEALGVPLVTRDRRLAAAARSFCEVILP